MEKTTGNIIREARKKAGMTQGDVAKKIGVKTATIAQWENDLRNPKLDTLRKLAFAIGISLTDMIPELAYWDPWREASCPPPTHVDEWDADGEHYHFDVSDEVWIFCSDGTRLLGRYDKENGWFESNGPQISSHNHGSVTHWMLLPEPPKGVA